MASLPLARPRPWSSGRFPPIRPRWLVLAGLLIAVAAGWGAWAQLASTRTSRPVYQTSTVARGTLRTTVSATGPIANPTSVPLGFKNSGRIAEIYVLLGDRVTAGQILAQLDTTELAAQVAQAEASLTNAEAAERAAAENVTPEQAAEAEATLAAAHELP